MGVLAFVDMMFLHLKSSSLLLRRMILGFLVMRVFMQVFVSSRTRRLTLLSWRVLVRAVSVIFRWRTTSSSRSRNGTCHGVVATKRIGRMIVSKNTSNEDLSGVNVVSKNENLLLFVRPKVSEFTRNLFLHASF